MAKRYCVMVVSDLHCGHHEALWPTDLALPWGEKLRANKGQRYLLKCWEDLQREAKARKPDILVVNGDLVDGEQRKSAGTEASTTILAAQQKASVMLLEPLRDLVKELYVIRGTPYHDGRLGMDVEAIATQLGAVPSTKDWHSHSYLNLDVKGVVLNFQHGISVSGGLYRATAHDREGVWAALAGKEGKMPKSDAVIRSHCHYFTHVEHSTRHIVTSPAWQLQTEYMRKNSNYRMLPDIGALFIYIDPKEKERGEDPIEVRKWLYHLPAVHATVSGVA